MYLDDTASYTEANTAWLVSQSTLTRYIIRVNNKSWVVNTVQDEIELTFAKVVVMLLALVKGLPFNRSFYINVIENTSHVY